MKKKIALTLLIVVILLGIGGVYAYFATNAFKTDKELFFSYMTSDWLSDLKDENLKEYIKKQENNAYTNKGSIALEVQDDGSISDETLQMIKNSKIKESIFCYWCTIYEEELLKTENEEDVIINKVAISDLTKTKFQKRVFLTIENNRRKILESGTEVNFIEIADYINEKKNTKEEIKKLSQYFKIEDEEVLLVGIKMNRY